MSVEEAHPPSHYSVGLATRLAVVPSLSRESLDSGDMTEGKEEGVPAAARLSTPPFGGGKALSKVPTHDPTHE